jgi:tetratricopeptide (TPR) repeat protein
MDKLEAIEGKSDEKLRWLGANLVAAQIGGIIKTLGEADSLSGADRALLERAVAMLERVQSLDANATKPPAVKVIALGKLGEFERALREATAAHNASPGWGTAITIANVHRRMGNIEKAIAMWTIASDLDPKDVSALLEIGDAYLNQSNWQAAQTCYERALQRNPQDPWALPSIQYCKYKLTGDKSHLQPIKRRAGKKSDKCGVQSMLAGLLGTTSQEAGIRRARELLDRERAAPTV